MKRGFDILRDKALNRGLVFGRKERDRLGLRGRCRTAYPRRGRWWIA
jgi:hypothetical protein